MTIIGLGLRRIKRDYKKLGTLTILFLCVAGLMGASIGSAYSSEAEIEDMLRKRSSIMENVLFGKITYAAGRDKLKEIETDSLLRRDLDKLVEFRDSDVDSVVDMSVVEFTRQSSVNNVESYIVKIAWSLIGYDGKYGYTEDYLVSTTMESGSRKLISLEIKDN